VLCSTSLVPPPVWGPSVVCVLVSAGRRLSGLLRRSIWAFVPLPIAARALRWAERTKAWSRVETMDQSDSTLMVTPAARSREVYSPQPLEGYYLMAMTPASKPSSNRRDSRSDRGPGLLLPTPSPWSSARRFWFKGAQTGIVGGGLFLDQGPGHGAASLQWLSHRRQGPAQESCGGQWRT
jgi:hypothetical protein